MRLNSIDNHILLYLIECDKRIFMKHLSHLPAREAAMMERMQMKVVADVSHAGDDKASNILL